MYERSGKNMVWSIKILAKYLVNLKIEVSRQQVSPLMIFSTLYTTLPHNLIKEKLIDLIEQPFLRRKVSYSLLVMTRKRFLLLQNIIEDIIFGLVRMYVTPYRFSWTIFISDLVWGYTANSWYSYRDEYKLCSSCSWFVSVLLLKRFHERSF